MKQTRMAVLTVAVTAALVALVSVAVASGGGKPRPAVPKLHPDRSFETLKFKPDPAIAADGLQRSRGGRLQIAYLVSEPVPVGGFGSVGFRGRCPAGGRPVDGGFATDGGIVTDLLAPSGPHTYDYRVLDVTGVAGTVTFTLTCLR